MRSTLAIAAIATFAASAFAATDCNPSYNVAPSTKCYTACNVKHGEKWVPGWTMDHQSEKFLDSLALMCNRSGPNYGSFMAAAGMCMAGCAGDDPESFNKEWKDACTWWGEHKNDKCTAATTTTKVTTTTTTTKADTTTTSTKADTTTTSTKDDTTTTSTKADTTTTGTTATATTGTATVTSTTTATATATATTTATTTVTGVKIVTVTVSNCPAPTGSACLSGYRGKKNGKGPENACCSTQRDCIESCKKGKCTDPVANVCLAGVKGKKKGNGKTGHCCSSSQDCKQTCRSGVCGF